MIVLYLYVVLLGKIRLVTLGIKKTDRFCDNRRVKIFTYFFNRFVKPFVKEVDYWERAFSVITTVLELMQVVQNQFLHLEVSIILFYSTIWRNDFQRLSQEV
jgi:hypothetical protein